VLIGLAVALVACEKTQTAPSVRKPDTKVWDTAKNPYVAPGFKANDQASWESQIKERAAWQNEYPRVTAGRE
jgi:hypothetical protein